MKIDVVGNIGWDVTAKDFMNAVKETADGQPIDITVTSAGGSFFDGFAMYEFLKSRPEKVIVRVDSYALSAAMYLVLAADEVVAGPSALFMLHRVWTVMAGNANELSAEVQILRLFDSVLFDIVARETGRSLADIEQEIDHAPGGEAWYKGEELMNKLFRTKEAAPEAVQEASPEVVSPGADSQEGAAVNSSSSNRYLQNHRNELQRVMQERDKALQELAEVRQELKQERTRMLAIAGTAGCSNEVVQAITNGTTVEEFVPGYTAAYHEGGFVPPAPLANVNQASLDYAKAQRAKVEEAGGGGYA